MQPDRRQFLASAAAAGLMPSVLAADAPKKARSCILLWMNGGPSQIDTFDMKPDTPVEFRGEFKPMATSVPGVQFCEHLPKLAKHANKLAVIRSMNTVESQDHVRAIQHLMTGYPYDGSGVNYPWVGSVVAKYKANPKPELPGCVTLAATGQPAEGFLGADYRPARLTSHASAEGKFKKICDIATEWDRYGKVYGNTPLGKNCLAARRMIEAGVPFVQVTHDGYDLHADLFPGMKSRLAQLDPAWSGLIADLNDRGLLDSTLVVWMGEFGRTPKVNHRSGRDHWCRGWSVVLAGGGVKGGVVHGATGRTGDGVKDNPVTAGDLWATIYTALGIDPKATNKVDHREVALLPDKALVVKELLGL